MDILFYLLITYLVIINLIAVIATVFDKVRAIRGKWRVKESTLLLISALGGSVSMYITMQLIRHKTRHLKFMLGIPVIITCQCVIAFFIWRAVNV